MTINEALDYDMKHLNSLNALVDKRIYEVDVPENISGSYVVWTKIGEPLPDDTNIVLPIRNARFQFSCFSQNKFIAKNISEVIITQYRKMSTLIGSSGDFEIRHTTIVDVRDFGKDGEMYRVDVDIRFKYRETP